MKDKLCKCTHIRTQHHKGLCANCPCTMFTNSIRTKKADDLILALMVIMMAGLVFMPISLVYDWYDTDDTIGKQIIMTESGKELSYNDIIFLLFTMTIFADIFLMVIYIELFTTHRKIMRRKDYNLSL